MSSAPAAMYSRWTSATALELERLSSSKHFSKLAPRPCSMVPMAPSARIAELESRERRSVMKSPLGFLDHREGRAVTLNDVVNRCIRIRGLIQVEARQSNDVVIAVQARGLVRGVDLEVWPSIELKQMSGPLDPDGGVGRGDRGEIRCGLPIGGAPIVQFILAERATHSADEAVVVDVFVWMQEHAGNDPRQYGKCDGGDAQAAMADPIEGKAGQDEQGRENEEDLPEIVVERRARKHEAQNGKDTPNEGEKQERPRSRIAPERQDRSADEPGENGEPGGFGDLDRKEHRQI